MTGFLAISIDSLVLERYNHSNSELSEGDKTYDARDGFPSNDSVQASRSDVVRPRLFSQDPRKHPAGALLSRCSAGSGHVGRLPAFGPNGRRFAFRIRN